MVRVAERVRRLQQVVAADVDEVARELEVAGLARRPVQLDQRHLRDRVAARPGALVRAWAERPVEVVGRGDRHGQQRRAAGRAELRDGRLDQRAVVEDLVVPGEPFVPAGPLSALHVRVEVAVVGLRGRDAAGVRVQPGELLRIARPAGVPRDRLEPLVRLAVLEARPVVLGTRCPKCHIVEVQPGPLALQVRRAPRDRRRPVRVLQVAKEPAVELDGRQRKGRERGRRERSHRPRV